MTLPGHQSITLSVAMTTQLWCHSVLAMACNACHALEIFIIQTSANFEKSKTKFFSYKYFFSNQQILCSLRYDANGRIYCCKCWRYPIRRRVIFAKFCIRIFDLLSEPDVWFYVVYCYNSKRKISKDAFEWRLLKWLISKNCHLRG